jgi:hypothetical protein
MALLFRHSFKKGPRFVDSLILLSKLILEYCTITCQAKPGGGYQQEKNEKDEEDDAIEDERRDQGRDGAAGGLRAVGHRRACKRAIATTSLNAEELGLKEGREIGDTPHGRPQMMYLLCVHY